MRQESATVTFDAMVAARTTNLRQMLQAATRRLNIQIAGTLQQRGYTDITATHTMLLSNMTLVHDTVTSISQRANVSAQAVGRLVRELQDRGYMHTVVDGEDARRRPIALTHKGRKLMEASFAILADCEERLVSKVGAESVDVLRQCLESVVNDPAS